MSIDLYGLPNCDATNASKKALEMAGVDFIFHDIRKRGPSELKLKQWIDKLGWEKILNRRSTTWKELPEPRKNIELHKESVLQLIVEHVTLMKRPVLELDCNLFIGKDAIHIHSIKSF